MLSKKKKAANPSFPKKKGGGGGFYRPPTETFFSGGKKGGANLRSVKREQTAPNTVGQKKPNLSLVQRGERVVALIGTGEEKKKGGKNLALTIFVNKK